MIASEISRQFSLSYLIIAWLIFDAEFAEGGVFF